jgi:hypothetical protein
VVVARSRDGGKSWQDYQCVTRYKESPGDLTELGDGTVVLTYGEQNFPYGSRAVVSRDQGRSWEQRTYILGFSTVQVIFPHVWSGSSPQLTEPGWRVSSVGLKDGTVVSFYTRGSLVVPVPGADGKEDTGKTMDKGKAVLAVRWRMEGLQKPPLSYPGVKCALNAEGYVDNGRDLIRPEHLNWGGDYLSLDEILAYERLAGEHHILGPGQSPVVALDPDGNPVVSSGTGQIYRSTDQGRTWQHLCDAPLQTVEYIKGFGVLRDGTMLVGGSSSVILRSEDMGQTWSRVQVPIPGGSGGLDECHHISQLPDGTVMLPITAGGGWVVYRSRDSGKSWGDWNYRNAYNDLLLKSGRMLGLMRCETVWQPGELIDKLDIPQNKARFYWLRCNTLIWSNDKGYTWNHPPRTVTRYNETPGDLALMADGTVVTTYHNKNNPIGARGMISRDEGMTWDKTLYMLGWWRFSGGFSSTQVLPDGRIVTADTGWSPGDNYNRVEVTIWKPLPAK